MSTQFYGNSEEAWTAMLSSINKAEHSIYWEIYIFQNDTFDTHDFVGALEQKAREGIDVILLADGFGSYNFDQDSIKRLMDAGAEVLFYRHPFWRTHRKLLVVDERTAFFGGVNISNQHRKWADLHVATTSKTTIRALLNTFARFYALCGGKNERVLAFSERAQKKAKKGESPEAVQELIVDHLPNVGKKRLRPIYEKLLRNAKDKVTIVTPYFFPAQWLIDIFDELIERGVRIEVMYPKQTDPKYLNMVHRIISRELAPKGISFKLVDHMLHAKAILIDDMMGLVGSQNIDPISFGLTMETGVFFHDKASLTRLESIIQSWRDKSKAFDIKEAPRKFYDGFVRLLMRAVTMVLG